MSLHKQTYRRVFWSIMGMVGGFVVSAQHVVAAESTIRTDFGAELPLGDRSPIEVIIGIVNWALGLLALLAVILILYAGFLWMTSRGNEDQIRKAKDVLKSAVIGLAIILAAWGIVAYVLQLLLGITGGSGDDTTDPTSCTGCSVPGQSSPLYVYSTNPTMDQEGVLLCTDTTVRMSMDVDKTSITPANFFVEVSARHHAGRNNGETCAQNNECLSGVCNPASVPGVCEGSILPGDIGFGPGDTTAYFNFIPTNDLEPDTWYHAVVQGGANGVQSLDPTPSDSFDDSVGMVSSYDWYFHTGTETDAIPPRVLESGSSPYPGDNAENICLNTPIAFQFSEPMRITSFNDTQAMVLTLFVEGSPDWAATLGLKDWGFGATFDQVSVRPNEQLQAFTDYAVRLYGGDPNNNFAGAVQDSCGNSLSGDADDIIEGSEIDDYFPLENTNRPINWTTSDTAECTPTISDIEPSQDYYGEYAGKYEGDACTSNAECGSGTCSSGFCLGARQGTTLTIRGQNLIPFPEVYFEGPNNSVAADGLLTCFDPSHRGAMRQHLGYGDICLDDEPGQSLQSPGELHLRTPVGADNSNIAITVAGASSEPSAEELQILSPYVAFVDPADGSIGQYVTVSGRNFGNDQGTSYVHIQSPDGTRSRRMELPQACGDVWTDTEIVVIVPEEYTDSTGAVGLWQTGDEAYMQVVVQEPDATLRYSNLQYFTFSDIVRPNLCQIIPECHNSAGQSFEATGDRFGNSQGESRVAFAYGEGLGFLDHDITSWINQRITGTTNTSMTQQQYWVTIFDAATNENSNGRSYDIPCSNAPSVVDISQCTEGEIYPVPNPRPNETNACVNAKVGILFDRRMDESSLRSSFTLERFNSGASFENSATPVGVAGTMDMWNVEYNGQQYYGFQFLPEAVLASDTWYQVTINTTARTAGADPVSLPSPYVMQFHTDASRTLCAIDSMNVDPASVVHNAYWDPNIPPLGDVATTLFTSSGYAQCRLIRTDDLEWDWSLEEPGNDIGNFGPGQPDLDDQENVFVAGNTEENEGTAVVNVEADDVRDAADFTVDLGFCEDDTDCASCSGSVCDEASHRCTPVVQSVTPLDGDSGTWATIRGCMFGGERGNVLWNPTDGSPPANTAWPDAAQCGSTWSSDTIIAEVPATTPNDDDTSTQETALPNGPYHVEVETAEGHRDEYQEQIFTVNDTLRPGLCVIEPNRTQEFSAVTAIGKTLGTTEGFASFLTDDDRNGDGVAPERLNQSKALTDWSDTNMNTEVPSGAVTGHSAISDPAYRDGFLAVTDTNVNSNPLDFYVSCRIDTDCSTGCCTDSGTCLPAEACNYCETNADCNDTAPDGISCSGISACVDNRCTPVVTSVQSDTGPNGGPTTVFGCYFGSYRSGASDVDFNNISARLFCDDPWSNERIISEVPPTDTGLTAPTSASIRVTDSAGAQSNDDRRFSVIDECVAGVPVPGTGVPVLCRLNPTTGRAASEDQSRLGTAVDFYGFGGRYQASGQQNIFPENLVGDAFALLSADLAQARVPYQASSGLARVEVQECPSNSLDFYAECQVNSDCGPGQHCGGTNICEPGESESCTVTEECDLGEICTEENICEPGESCATNEDCDGGEYCSPSGVCTEDACGAGCTRSTEADACYVGEGCSFDTAISQYCCNALPTITSRYPIANQTDVCTNGEFYIEFSEEMTTIDADDTLLLRDGTGAVIPINVNAATTDKVTFTATAGPLQPENSYSITVVSNYVVPSDQGIVSSTTGLRLSEGTHDLSFTTGAGPCVPTAVDLKHKETQQDTYTFTIPETTEAFEAKVFSNDQPLASSGELTWEFSWGDYYDDNRCNNVAWVELPEEGSDITATSSEQNVSSGNEDRGATAIYAIAQGTGSAWSGQLRDEANIFTNFCSGTLWEFIDDAGRLPSDNFPQNFRLAYCNNGDLPNLELSAEPETDDAARTSGDTWYRQYILSNPDERTQAFAIRVYSNIDRVSPLLWYDAHAPNPGNPGAQTIDGYEAAVDGYSYYVAASNVVDDAFGDPSGRYYLENNIYLFTFNNDTTLLNIANEILTNLRFNVNLSYAQCEASEKQRLTRDTKRINDIGTIAQHAKEYYTEHDAYPLPQSDQFGSYVKELTVSVWNSWQGALGNIFGTTLPTDPYNFFYASDEDDPWNAGDTPWVYTGEGENPGDCPYKPEEDITFDTAGTCWDPLNKYFYCPENSHTYLWKVDEKDSQSAELYAHLEYQSDRTQDYITNRSLYNPCSSPSACQCYNYQVPLQPVSSVSLEE